MNDPTQYADLGDDFMLDEQEVQRQLSNEQVEEIQAREESVQEQMMAEEEVNPTQPVTAGQPAPMQPEPQPTGEETQEEEKGYFEGLGQRLSYFGQPLDETNQQVKERLSAPGQGFFDFVTEAINSRLPDNFQIPKATKYEDSVAQATRNISSVVMPTVLLQKAGMAAGRAAQAKVGSKLGQTAFMKFIGARGIEAGASVAVGSVSSQYTEDNALGMVKKALPPQWDFIPDNWATLDGDSTDKKRQKNINEDLGLGLLIPFVGVAKNLIGNLEQTKRLFRTPVIVGETPQAVKALAEIEPPPKSADAEEVIEQYIAKQEADLDELGYYNMSKNSDTNVPMKGVHDLYDFRETGMRSVDDFGIVGASVDAARIAANKGTVYGRLGNFISGPALKYGIETPGGVEEITVGLAKQLKDADRYRMDAADWAISFDEIQAQGDNLVLELIDPSANVDDIKRLLGPAIQTNEFGVEVLTEEGFKGALRSINNMVDEFTDMDIARAQAYTATSMAGQIADLAEGIRINKGSVSIDSAKEKLLDNIRFFQQLVGSTRYYTTKKQGFLAIAEKIQNYGKSPQQIATRIRDSYPQALVDIQTESDKFTESWQYLQKNRPEMLDTFLELYEASDGEISSIYKLNEDILNKFVRTRLIYDPNPENPNLIVSALRGNYFNSLLSATSTAANALYGNLSGIVAEPVSYFAGSVMRGDLKSIQRGWMAYSAMFDTQKKALPYAGRMFAKASQNPNSVASQTRLDLIIKQEEKLDKYRYIAKLEADNGNTGFQHVLDFYEESMAMANDPLFRLTPNMFTGFDSWTGATLANANARFRAMDELDRLGEAATPARVKELADVEYDSMFDGNNLIKDKATKYDNANVALNLDSEMAQVIGELTKSLPILTPFLTFPKMMTNVVRVADEYVPAPLRSFQKDINELAYTPLKNFMSNPELVDEILTRRGHNVNMMDPTAKLNTVIDLKNTTLGRKGIGTFFTSLVIANVLKDKLFGDGLFSTTGDGSYDRQLDRARQKNSNYKPRSAVGPSGRRYEYNQVLGPGLSTWVSAVATVAENFDMLGETMLENTFPKLAFILGASITDPAGVSALRPLVELLGGNEAHFNRFTAGVITSLGPLGGMRNEMGRILEGGYKEVETDIIAQLANRNQIVGVIDETNRLPTVISPVTGEAPNKYSMLQRLFNHYSPVKVHPSMSKEEQFLYDVEYDISSAFSSRNGVKLLSPERAALNAEMGKSGRWKRSINSIMKTAEALKTIKTLRAARRPPNFISSEKTPLAKFDQIHMLLSIEQKLAEEEAFLSLEPSMQKAINERIVDKKLNEEAAELGIIPTRRY